MLADLRDRLFASGGLISLIGSYPYTKISHNPLHVVFLGFQMIENRGSSKNFCGLEGQDAINTPHGATQTEAAALVGSFALHFRVWDRGTTNGLCLVPALFKY